MFTPQLDRLDSTGRELAHAQFIVVTDLYAWTVLRQDAGLDALRAQTGIAALVERVVT